MKRILILSLFCFAAAAWGQPEVYKIDDLEKRIAHPDTVYVVNFWATWCKPCVKELPAFDSLHNRYAGTNTRVLLVSLDFTEHIPTRVTPFLTGRKLKAECVVLDEINGDVFINRVHPDWSGAIPATLIKRDTLEVFAERPLTLRDLETLRAQVINN